MITSNDPGLDLRAAREYSGLSEKTLRRYIAAGRVKAYRVGARKIMIKRSDLDALSKPIPAAGDAA